MSQACQSRLKNVGLLVGGISLVVLLLGQINPAYSSVGGPALVEPLGWNPETGEVFFREIHVGESGYAPYILRLQLSETTHQFERVQWSIEVPEDSTYQMNLQFIERRLSPLNQRLTTTIPSIYRVTEMDTIESGGIRWPSYRVRVRWFNGACVGSVEAMAYRDPSLRMVRLYSILGRDDLIGVFSYIGIPFETGYEVQVPVLLPQERETVVELDWTR